MIKRLLRSIRQKPKTVRDNIALGMAGTFTAVIFSVWLYHLPTKIASLAESTQLDRGEEAPGFADFFGEIKDQMATLNEATDRNLVESETSSIDSAATTANWQENLNFSTSTEEIATSTVSITASNTAVLLETPTLITPTSSNEVIRSIRIVTTSSTLPVAATTTEVW